MRFSNEMNFTHATLNSRHFKNVLFLVDTFSSPFLKPKKKGHGPCEIPRDANGPGTGHKMLCPWQDETPPSSSNAGMWSSLVSSLKVFDETDYPLSALYFVGRVEEGVWC